jgi:hypothetical protein
VREAAADPQESRLAAHVPTLDDLRALLSAAWEEVRDESPCLFEYKRAVERPLVARLAHYLSCRLASPELRWDELCVDVDLHAAEDGTKPGVLDESRYGQPDLVIHRRRVNTHNILLLEAKHRSAPTPDDRTKLKRIADHYGYSFVAAVELKNEPFDAMRVTGRGEFAR